MISLEAANQEQLSELANRLSEPEGPKWIHIQYDHAEVRDEMIDELVAALPDFQHIVLDLSRTQVARFEEVLHDKLPDEIRESNTVRFLVHVVNLETSLFYEMINDEAVLLPNLDAIASTLTEQLTGYVLMVWSQTGMAERIEHQAPDFWQMADETYRFQTDVDATDDQKTAVSELRDQLTEVKGAERIPLLRAIARLYQQMDDNFSAILSLAEARKLALEVEAKDRLAGLYADLSEFFHYQGRPQAARDFARLAYDHRDAAATPTATGRALFVKALYQVFDGDVEEGFTEINEALGYFEAANNNEEAAKAHLSLAQYFISSRDSRLGARHFKMALDHYTEEADWQRIGSAAQALAALLEHEGDLERAIGHYRDATRAYEHTDNRVALARSWQQIGSLYQNQLRYQRALASFENALEHAEIAQDDYLMAALEDSVDEMRKKVKQGSKGSKGFLGKLFT